ncbi:MAG: TolC family protein [Deferribacteres bacterium]|nr:TolC family protein [Deferribacteres bacterium]
MNRTAIIVCLLFLLIPHTGSTLTLEEGLKIVTERGRDINISRAEEDAAREGVGLARSPLLPRVDLYANQTWLRYQPEAIFGPASVPVAEKDSLSYGFRVHQLVYDFGRTYAMLRASRSALKGKELDTVRTRNLAALDFTLAYLDLLESERLLKVARDEVKRFEAHLNDARAMHEQGLVTKNDVLQAEVMLSDARQSLLSAENLRSVRASVINSLLMRPLNEEVLAEEPPVETPYAGISLEDAWKTAVQSRAEIKALRMRIKAKNEEFRAVKAEFYPGIYLSGGYEYRENRYMVNEGNWSLLAGVRINLSSGGATRARMKMLRAELETLDLEAAKLTDAVRLEVKSAYLQLKSAGQKVGVTRQAVAQADENLRLQRLRYQEGEGTATDVLDAIALMSRAETNYWSARYERRKAGARLLYAMGKDIAGVYGGQGRP